MHPPWTGCVGGQIYIRLGRSTHNFRTFAFTHSGFDRFDWLTAGRIYALPNFYSVSVRGKLSDPKMKIPGIETTLRLMEEVFWKTFDGIISLCHLAIGTPMAYNEA